MAEYSPLLARQLKRYLKADTPIGPEWKALLDTINRSYEHFERDENLSKRSLEISSLELRQLISELSIKEEIFRQFSENSTDFFWMLSADLSEVIYISPNLIKFFGFSEENLPNSLEEWSHLIHSSDQPKFWEFIKAVSASSPNLEIEYRFQVPGQRMIWIRDHAFQVRDGKGVVYRIGGITRDVTEFKIAGIRKEIVSILNRYGNLEETTVKLLEMICKLFGWKLGLFWMVNPDKNEAQYFTSWYQDPAMEAFVKSVSTLPKKLGFIKQILGSHEALFIKNLESMPYFQFKAEAQEAGLQDVWGFPISLNGCIYAVITLFHTKMEKMDADLIEAFNEISQQICLFLERKRAEQELIESEERFRNTVEHTTIGIALVSPDGQFFQVNNSLCEMLEFSKEELQLKNVKEITFGEDLIKEMTYQRQLLAGEISSFQTEKRFITKNKNTLWAFISTSLVKNIQGLPDYFVYEVEDISQRKYTEEKLFYLAYYDLLTGLPNKKLVEDTLKQTLLTAALKNEKIALFFVKVNRFFRIKDTAGASIDFILKQIALRLVDRIPIKDIVARWGEDEFVIVISQIKSPEFTTLLTQKILSVLKEPFIIEERRFFLTASVGISIFPDDTNQAQLLFKNAQVAMNQANLEGIDNYHYYTEEMLKQSQEKLLLETLLRKAISSKEFFLNYQPIINIENNTVTCVEVLLRWNSKELGLVPPSKFISLAEENGFIIGIGEWALRKACQEIKELENTGFAPVIFAINISVLQLKDQNFLTMVSDILKEYKVDPHCLRFEIVENQLMENIEESIDKLSSLRRQNIQIAIDDFGIGYSSFNYLRQFTVDRFKIDIAFIRNIHKEPKNAGIVSAIVAMSQALGIPPIAEGVETKEELEFLKEIGLKEIQGYYLSAPLDLNQLKGFLANETN